MFQNAQLFILPYVTQHKKDDHNYKNRAMITAIIIGAIIIGFILWRNRPIKNSHKLPQIVEIKEYDNPSNNPDHQIWQKGHKLTLSREMGHPGFNLFVTIKTNGKDLTNLKKIIISWSEWKERIFSFKYYTSDENVFINGDQIKIDIGSFNNCPGSKNILKRTVHSETITIDLLDYEPERNDFEYENNKETQSVFVSLYSRDDLKKFNKGLHFIDS